MDVAALVRVLACVSHTCKRGEDSVTFCYGGKGVQLVRCYYVPLGEAYATGGLINTVKD